MDVEKYLGQIFDQSYNCEFEPGHGFKPEAAMSRERFIEVVTHLLVECREASVKSLFGLNRERSVIDSVRNTKGELT